MKLKVYITLTIASSLIGFMEWGHNNSTFIFQGEAEVIQKLFTDPGSVIHPLTIIPLIGQIILIVALFQPVPNKKLTYAGVICISTLLLFIFIIGLITTNYKTILSTLPFLTITTLTIRAQRKAVV